MPAAPKTSKNSKLNPIQTEAFLDILRQLQKVDPEFPLHYSICLAEIAMDEGLSLTQLAEKVGLGLSTVSRITGALSDWRQNGQSYGLIEQRIAPEERRRKELYLTAKGWAVMRGIQNVMEAYRSVR